MITTRAFRRITDPELRRLASEAYALWRDLAAKRGNPYGDHEYCLRAGRQAVDATRWEDGLVVLAAIERFMDTKSSPVRIPEWARELGAERRETLRQEQVKRERLEAERAAAAAPPPLEVLKCATCDHFPHRDADCRCCRERTYVPPFMKRVDPAKGLHHIRP